MEKAKLPTCVHDQFHIVSEMVFMFSRTREHLSCWYKAVMKLLLERDDSVADLNDNDGRTPLSWAAEGGDEAVVKLLVERDDVAANSKDKNGRTPLWWAEEEEHEAIVRLLSLKLS
jgi:ankyrin repeat protein